MSFNIGSVITNKVIMINIALLIISFGLFYKYKNPYFLFLMYGVCFINEIINYFTGLDLYDSHSRTELVYSLGEGFSSMISDDFDEVDDDEDSHVDVHVTECMLCLLLLLAAACFSCGIVVLVVVTVVDIGGLFLLIVVVVFLLICVVVLCCVVLLCCVVVVLCVPSVCLCLCVCLCVGCWT